MSNSNVFLNAVLCLHGQLSRTVNIMALKLCWPNKLFKYARKGFMMLGHPWNPLYLGVSGVPTYCESLTKGQAVLKFYVISIIYSHLARDPVKPPRGHRAFPQSISMRLAENLCSRSIFTSCSTRRIMEDRVEIIDFDSHLYRNSCFECGREGCRQ